MNRRQKFGSVTIVLIITGCSALTVARFENQFGPAQPREREITTVQEGRIDYWKAVKPVLESRCVVCHACYDAPCQLKLSSHEGVNRGASHDKVYVSSRLKAAPPTRLFEDAQSVPEWREKGFFPVLNEYPNIPEVNRTAGVMHRILELKQKNPLPEGKQLPGSFDLSLNRKQFCAETSTLSKYEREHPLWGMPYAFPGLEREEQEVLLTWLEQGAHHTPRPQLPEAYQQVIADWESFLNGNSFKHRLSSRYIYEHLFLGHLYFPEVGTDTFFRIVRSASPPGKPVELIATRRPYNDPGVDRVYYRIMREVGSIVAKTHMPYPLYKQRMDQWQEWFIDTDYNVTKLPGYEIRQASNPFLTFDSLPVRSRYRFLLDEAQFSIMSFIKGPVCRGQVALSVINDHFWVFFVDPDNPKLDVLEQFASEQIEHLELPASMENIYRPISHWKRYAAQQKALLEETDAYLVENFIDPGTIDIDLVWNGDGTNSNAALTVFRHFDTASVVKGLVGKPPKTAWLISFTLLERIHYLLVAGYDVYGNLGHQLLSRVYMDFLRMEGETSFLMFLPRDARDREREFWYRGAHEDITEFMVLPRFESKQKPGINYHGDNQKLELYDLLQSHLQDVLPDTGWTGNGPQDNVSRVMETLDGLTGEVVTLLPEVSLVQVTGRGEIRYFTQMRNSAHFNITSLFGEKKFRKPDEDSLTVVPGFVGAYPNMYFSVGESEVSQYAKQLKAMAGEEDYSRLLDRYGVRRTNPEFWKHSDSFSSGYRKWNEIEYGLFDLGRYENR